MTLCGFSSHMSPMLAIRRRTAPYWPSDVGAGKLGKIVEVVDLALGIDRRYPDAADAEAGDDERIGLALVGQRALAAAGIADIGDLDLAHVDGAARRLALEASAAWRWPVSPSCCCRWRSRRVTPSARAGQREPAEVAAGRSRRRMAAGLRAIEALHRGLSCVEHRSRSTPRSPWSGLPVLAVAGGRPSRPRRRPRAYWPGTALHLLHLLHDLRQIVGRGILHRRERDVGLELLQPQRLADRQHVPVVDIGGRR